ncbi:MAG: DNA replication complex subunit Gins51 [Candidatus Hodarchaeales archaeon]
MEYKEIYDLWKAQKDSNTLINIPADFYVSVDGKLAKLYEKSSQEDWPELVDKVIERLEFLRQDIAKQRLFRILNSIIFDVPLDEKSLTWSERKIINNLQKSIESLGISDISSHDSPNILDTQDTSPNMDLPEDSEAFNNQIEENIHHEPVSPKNLLIRVLDDVEAFIGIDKKQYGPLIKNDIVFLPADNAKVLIAKDLARIMETD